MNEIRYFMKMDDNLSLRLIGLYLHPMDANVSKNLKPGWYPFGKYPEPKNGFVDVPPISDIEANLYKTSPKSPRITVSCIVGKNGAGKSSLLDIFYRIVNNLAYVLSYYKNSPIPSQLSYANGVNAELYYVCDGKLNRIECAYKNVSVYREDNYGFMSKIRLRKSNFNNILKGFFYTIAVNYSIYSFDENDYGNHNLVDEHNIDGKWLEGLFHKNDAYMTPITLVPYRTQGAIDVKRENELAHQRILVFSLLFLAKRKQFPYGYRPKYVSFRLRKKYQEEIWYKFINTHKEWNNLILEDFRVELEKVWEDFVSADLVSLFGKDSEMYRLVLFYLSYKSLKICLTYSDYYNQLSLGLHKGKIKTNDEADINNLNAHLPMIAERVVAKIREQPINHITLKIHQCLDYIKRNDARTEGRENAYSFISRFPAKSYEDVFLHLMYPSFFEMDIEYVRVEKKKEDDFEVFEKDSNTSFELSKMSSGEKQMMYMVSYVIYHLNNIQSVDSDNYRIPYHYVNLVFDEAELYYHPEYQRRFVAMLLESLSAAGIDRRKIRSVNILIATHSPFILSDVLTENSLYLSEGNPVKVEKQTFGANYYDMLRSSFFFTSSPIGDVAAKAMKRWILSAKRNDKTPSAEIMRMVGDPFIANYLQNLEDNVQDS